MSRSKNTSRKTYPRSWKKPMKIDGARKRRRIEKQLLKDWNEKVILPEKNIEVADRWAYD